MAPTSFFPPLAWNLSRDGRRFKLGYRLNSWHIAILWFVQYKHYLTQCTTLCRADLWGSWKPGGEFAELDQRQPESADVHRTHREICRVQKPPGEVHTQNTRGWGGGLCSDITNLLVVSAAELFVGAEGAMWNDRKKQRGPVRGEFVFYSCTQLLPPHTDTHSSS